MTNYMARSAFSFLEGASVPEELIAACKKLEMPAMALLDRDGVYGSPRFYQAAKKNSIRAHIGAEVTVVQSPRSKVKNQRGETDFGHWTLDKLVLRLGLRYVKGLSEQSGRSIVRARDESPFQSIASLEDVDLMLRTYRIPRVNALEFPGRLRLSRSRSNIAIFEKQ